MLKFKVTADGLKRDYLMLAYKEQGTHKVRIFDWMDRVIYESDQINLSEIVKKIGEYEDIIFADSLD